jgi:hypothetical protein
LPVPSAPSAVTEAPAPVSAWTPTWTRSPSAGPSMA